MNPSGNAYSLKMAEKELRLAIHIKPYYLSPRNKLIHVLNEMNRFEEANEQLKICKTLGPPEMQELWWFKLQEDRIRKGLKK